jgi:hypothetical protein
MLERVIKAYNEAIFDTDRDQALKVVHDAVAGGVSRARRPISPSTS